MKPVSCINEKGKGSYGGSQMWWQDQVLLNSGCGIIAGLDSLLNLRGITEISRDEYLKLMTETSRYIKPLRLPFATKPIMIKGHRFLGSLGVTMPRLRRGLKKLTRKHGINCKVRTYSLNFVERTREILARDIPVILLIRAPFENVPMYDENGGKTADKLGQHFVTVTDYDENDGFFVVSSWGIKYKIDPKDLRQFGVAVRFCYVDPINAQ
ncbi:hypothetical protein SAMN02910456_01996 [Ruminococcaceae bacterium YRB3002]|nr:hypothetical protein SAMN02910456_01996 [Ruminococcaceae bacterium YRB3002]